MKRDLFIKEIDDYHNVIGVIAEEEYHKNPYSISEYESVYQDILDYEEEQFENWTTKDFKDFIKYLEHLTGLRSKLKEVL